MPSGGPSCAAAAAAACLLNESGRETVTARNDAIFELLADRSPPSIDALCRALSDPRETSVLLLHEVAYALGQSGSRAALPTLSAALADTQRSEVVRHEAAEALGAIGDPASLPLLREYAARPGEHPEVVQTCVVAADRIARSREDCAAECDEYSATHFESVDPAPALRGGSVGELRALLLDGAAPLYERYRAMFALRNRARGLADPAEVLEALCAALLDVASGALFRHEVAYVLGQLQMPGSVWALRRVLDNAEEPAIVRHECAEAMGSIATPECLEALERAKHDSHEVVSQSCQVALDILAFETAE
eukprot:m51a1_g11248 putative deoxyhypusine hydroxylase (308) ;mRNA; f:31702-32625